jgi:hypothetical protein
MEVGEVWTGLYIDAKRIRGAINRIKLLHGKRFKTMKDGDVIIVRRIE